MTQLTELPSATITSLPSTRTAALWKILKFVSDLPALMPEEIQRILPILEEEARARELRQIRYLLARSGIKRIKRIEDFDGGIILNQSVFVAGQLEFCDKIEAGNKSSRNTLLNRLIAKRGGEMRFSNA